jgi:RNA polymerase sigma-70 factor (ECF subfamily)
MAHMSQRDPRLAVSETSGEDTLTALYREYSVCIHSYAFHLLDNQEDADDVTQEVFIRAHMHLTAVRDPGRVRPWLYRIATNLCMDHLRRRTRQRRLFGLPIPLGGEHDEERAPALEIAQPGSTAMIDGVAERDHIQRVLRRMPPKYSSCLLLHSSYGLSYREIADALEIKPGAAAVRLTRARDLFMRYYEELKGEEGR